MIKRVATEIFERSDAQNHRSEKDTAVSVTTKSGDARTRRYSKNELKEL